MYVRDKRERNKRDGGVAALGRHCTPGLDRILVKIMRSQGHMCHAMDFHLRGLLSPRSPDGKAVSRRTDLFALMLSLEQANGEQCGWADDLQ